MIQGHLMHCTLKTTNSGEPTLSRPSDSLVPGMIKRHAFDHIKLAAALREVMRFHQIGHSFANKDDVTWRRALMGHRQKDYFNHHAVAGLARLDDGPEMIQFFSGLLPLTKE